MMFQYKTTSASELQSILRKAREKVEVSWTVCVLAVRTRKTATTPMKGIPPHADTNDVINLGIYSIITTILFYSYYEF